MEVTEDQKREYQEQGYLLYRNLLSADEIGVLQDALTEINAMDGPQVKRESPEVPPSIVYAPHALSPSFDALSRLPRIIKTVEALLGESAYIYQSRVNLKMPFTSDGWAWHQDFTAWHRGDGMPSPHAIMVAVFLHDCTPSNGPLLVIPGSHSDDLDEILSREEDVPGYKAQRVPLGVIESLAKKASILDLSAPAGSVAFIHPTLMHGSAANLTPWPRSISYFNFNAVSNRPSDNKRPWFMNNPDTAPLQALGDDALTTVSTTA
ncbi:ectoine dioxygenase (plasmid) [Antarctobacter heliothermus]|uniref:Ectoine dioxygenase n=1 Tax=Antarctobacter heliothermus TaxID=74033 RepID=A0A222EBR6_9RHOB|nr:phytanoyl-CoA dioxygenase family protein [Antarctobacter heliothermus]ASP23550.1 ectoine dioxygenase [Antarctobacter heliothermus]